MKKYIVMGRPRAGSLIAEFLLTAANVEYEFKNISIEEAEQDEFKSISPFSKIPAIIDHSNNKESVFESGAILIYLAEKSGKFYEKENKLKIDQWLMAQMGSIGPFIGQYHFFYKFNKGLSEVGEKRYFEMTKKVYEVLENHL